ncbi:TIGR04086 family membrane protein [Aneurinibacillus sp. Ricciae_BoGa-3]|uniref:TIGR04086 family membrane protein n=1 Tax=Aneurinibacillus sp. Ricciae_BoGa-3 TaxID=3022697 RepID=UPI0023414E11|nr:TIGR04086 family membrane protein [Aneurinibacillus sp. Ricciae_BoGa-3]WCK53614.1 TIGR04086 family membrane protein [Aneurinibacillus sp. Ricciae_BoGa-3]
MFKVERFKPPILSGIMYAVCIVVAGSILTSLILAFSSVKESSLPTFVYTFNILALFSGGFTSGKRAGEKGWYYGGMTGLLYYLCIVLFSFLGYNAAFGLHNLYYAALAFAIAALGGIIGVNLSHK